MWGGNKPVPPIFISLRSPHKTHIAAIDMSTSKYSHVNTKSLSFDIRDFRDETFYPCIRQLAEKRAAK